MNRLAVTLLLGALLSISAAAQAGQQTPANPLSTYLRARYMGVRNNIARSAEKMPEENYGMRPGPQLEVRTFGQQVGHIAKYSYLWCSQAKGEKNPIADIDPEKLATKAELVKVLNDAFAYCDGAYTALTDANGADMVDTIQENGAHSRAPRMGLLILNYGHSNEVYGSMVTYLRIKSIVPASSEPKPAQPPMQR